MWVTGEQSEHCNVVHSGSEPAGVTGSLHYYNSPSCRGHCSAKPSTLSHIIKFLILFSQLPGTPYNNLEDLYSADYADYDDNNQVSEEEAIMMAPSFVSSSLDVVVNEGETIRLPCIVSRSVETLGLGLSGVTPVPVLTVATIVSMKFSINCISI